jgi:NADH dehydrogenase (ubiquinone) Fe-S protein 3
MTEKSLKSIAKMIPKWVKSVSYSRGESCLLVDPQQIVGVLSFLRDHVGTRYQILVDVTAVDYPSIEKRFCLVYNLLTLHYNRRIRVKGWVDEITPVSSVTQLYPSAGWWEREVWDMFGIFFGNHPDLRRILTDYGFQGHPLRKDFPLTGFVEVRYDDSEKGVVTEKVEVTQEFRYFDFSSPWEQLPTKEKE